jgi:PAS domain S-box-containing protein
VTGVQTCALPIFGTGHFYWSDEVYRILGLEPGQTLPAVGTFLLAVHQEDREALEAAFRTALEQQQGFDTVHRILRSNGELRVVRNKAESVLDARGIPTALIGMVHDVTEHHGSLCEQCPILGCVPVPEGARQDPEQPAT